MTVPPETAGSEGRQFHLGDLLSITDGHLVSPDGIDGVYRIIDFVTGESNMTHMLLVRSKPVELWLIQRHPWLDEITVPGDLRRDTKEASQQAVNEWLAPIIAKYGEYHEVDAMPEGWLAERDPIDELVKMVGPERVIPVVFDEAPAPDQSASEQVRIDVKGVAAAASDLQAALLATFPEIADEIRRGERS